MKNTNNPKKEILVLEGGDGRIVPELQHYLPIFHYLRCYNNQGLVSQLQQGQERVGAIVIDIANAQKDISSPIGNLSFMLMAFPTVPVIAVTKNPNLRESVHGINLHTVLMKPVCFESLAGAVVKAVVNKEVEKKFAPLEVRLFNLRNENKKEEEKCKREMTAYSSNGFRGLVGLA